MIMLMVLFYGLILGSFVNALVWRIHEQSLASNRKNKKIKEAKNISITRGRSMCTACGHQLHAKDLIPVLSWLFLKGKCRYCKTPISPQYPIVELATTILFVVSFHFWPYGLSTIYDKVNLLSWFIMLVGFVALAVYDFRWMLLPNRVVFPVLGVALANWMILFTQSLSDPKDLLVRTALGIAISWGIFQAIYTISKGKWIGGGDVKLGLVIGVLLSDPIKSFLVLFMGSLLGSIFSIPSMARKKKTDKSILIPFGPFLIVGTYIAFIFGDRIIDWYQQIVFLSF
jgi:leader peptidase (prepilin peptidase)/N-methyltransferase